MAFAAQSTGLRGNASGGLPLHARQSNNLAAPAENGNPLNGELKAFVDSLRGHYRVPGISVGVVHGDETYLSGYGQASIEPSVDATPETLFYVGSITKSILAASLLHTLESTTNSKKPVTLDTKLRVVIPDDFVTPDEYATQRATLRDALHHRLGYPRHDTTYGGEGFTVKDVVRSLRHLSMSAELREKFQYCNMGFMTLQHVVETITGKWCGDVYDEAVFGPLDMTSSTAELKKAQESSNALATGYANTAAKPHNPLPFRNSRLVGAGGVMSNVVDMAKYLRAMISKSGLPLSESSHRALLAPGMISPGSPPQHQSAQLYAAGWFVTTYRGHRYVHHNGAVPGFASAAGFLPDLEWGAVVLTNGDAGGMFAAEATFYKLLDDFLGVPEGDRIDYVEKWDKVAKSREEASLKARERVFPDIPSPPLPHTLPLGEYAGTYSHPGYRTLTFSVTKPEDDLPVAEGTTRVLHALKDQSEWDVVFDLEHVSGEHFICYINTRLRSPLVQMVVEPCAAEFEVGADGRASRLGIRIESSVGKIWFERVLGEA